MFVDVFAYDTGGDGKRESDAFWNRRGEGFVERTPAVLVPKERVVKVEVSDFEGVKRILEEVQTLRRRLA